MSVKTTTIFSLLFFCILGAQGQSYEDKRCRCICPSPAAFLNNSMNSARTLFIAYVPPDRCNCNEVTLPHVRDEIKSHELEYCPRCDCTYETRNTTIIMVVVVMVLFTLMMLAVYMGFLLCLDPLIRIKKVKLYKERGSEESCSLLIEAEEED